MGTYWEGHLDAALVSGRSLPMLLTEKRWPLKGNDHLTPQWELYAPEQPTFGSSLLGTNPFYSGRLTITCRDNFGTPLVTVFDFNGARAYNNMGDVWLQRSWPIVVESDLRELIDQQSNERKPPRGLKLQASDLKGDKVELPTPCQLHAVYYPIPLAFESSHQQKYYVFHTSCECGTAYIVATQPDGAHFLMGGDPVDIALFYESIPWPEHTRVDANGQFSYKEAPSLTDLRAYFQAPSQ